MLRASLISVRMSSQLLCSRDSIFSALPTSPRLRSSRARVRSCHALTRRSVAYTIALNVAESGNKRKADEVESKEGNDPAGEESAPPPKKKKKIVKKVIKKSSVDVDSMKVLFALMVNGFELSSNPCSAG